MKRLTSLLCVWSLAACVGCGPEPVDFTTRYQLGDAGPALEAMVGNYGGIDRLSAIDSLETDAVFTSYDDGTARVWAAHLILEPRQGVLYANGALPGGGWRARVGLDGRPGTQIQTTGALRFSPQERAELERVLRLVLHRVRGPLNLLAGGETVTEVEAVFTAGYELERIRVDGRSPLATAYFVDTQADELRFVTAGGDQPGADGTLTLYTNTRADGTVLPQRLRVVRIGRVALVGDRPVLEVQFTGWTVR